MKARMSVERGEAVMNAGVGLGASIPSEIGRAL